MSVDALEQTDHYESGFIFGVTSTGYESQSAGWKLRKYIEFHCDLSAPAMSTEMSQVGVALFPSF